MESQVSIVKVREPFTSESVSEAVRNAIQLVGGLNGVISKDAKVLIKPNLCVSVDDPFCGANTHPLVCKAIADMVSGLGGRPFIAESSAVGVDTERAFKMMGYDRLREEGYEVLDLKKDETVEIDIPQGKVRKKVATFKSVMEADVIITVPVMKTHDQAVVTLSLKNQKGLYTDHYKRLAHREALFEQVVDLNTVLKPAFVVVDGLYCQEGLGPIFGIPVKMGLVLAGRDMVSVDSVASSVMGFEPLEIPITRTAYERGMGEADLGKIDVLGERLENVRRRFMRVQEDDRVKVEGFKLVHNESTCTGCQTTVMSCIFDLRKMGEIDRIKGLTVVTGSDIDEGELQGVPEDTIITVGKCVPPEKRSRKHVKGCPPNNVWVIQEIVGGDVKRTYATEDETEQSTEVLDE